MDTACTCRLADRAANYGAMTSPLINIVKRWHLALTLQEAREAHMQTRKDIAKGIALAI